MELMTSRAEKKKMAAALADLQRGGSACGSVEELVQEVHARIPEKKRVSFGIYSVVKMVGERLFEALADSGVDVLRAAADLCEAAGDEKGYRVRGVALAMLSLYGLQDLQAVLPFFLSAASSSDWVTREMAQGLIRRLIHVHLEKMRAVYLELVRSADPLVRRFVSESLRPVAENRWLQQQTDFSLSILHHLFTESEPYPRTSVGNNLSDLSRRNPELVLSIVKELVDSGDPNSRWIAHRACRNLVKKHPERVLDLLGIDEYRYKQTVVRRRR